MKLFSNKKLSLIAQYYPTLLMEVKWFKFVKQCLNNHSFSSIALSPHSFVLLTNPPVIHKWDESRTYINH